MLAIRDLEPGDAALVGLGLRIMYLSAEAGPGIEQRLAGMGGAVERETEPFAALGAMLDDPPDYGLFVMECDGFGGIEAGRRLVARLDRDRRPMPCILISRDCAVQEFPEGPGEPVLLRAPVSAVSLRVGMEHALRGRLIWQRG